MTVVEVRKWSASSRNKELLNRYSRLREDFLWILTNEKKLRDKYANKFIAVEQESVKFSDTTIQGLMLKIKNSGQRMEDFAVEYIGESPVNFLF
jgi:hypothetical protein